MPLGQRLMYHIEKVIDPFLIQINDEPSLGLLGVCIATRPPEI